MKRNCAPICGTTGIHLKEKRGEVMSDEIEVEYVDHEDYRIFNLAIERLAQIIPALGFAIANFKDLEDQGFYMDVFKLEDAMVEIATVFAGSVARLKYIKPRNEEVRDAD
jgi:hypothetical protein